MNTMSPRMKMNELTRRTFMKLGMMSTLYLVASAKGLTKMYNIENNPIRLGGPIFKEFNDDPVEWIKAHKEWGYSAAYCPVEADAPEELIKAYESESKKNDIIIAEVGAWSNPISVDDKQRNEAIEYCIQQLNLADKIGANCCVNIAGSRNPDAWDGPHEDNLSQDTFDLIVETTQNIIDSVEPIRTYFTIETMPYVWPNSIESYEELIKKINRERFAVHFDPVNLINSPERYYNNAALIKEAFSKLGKYIKSCHGKDTIIREELTIHISETQPGLGNLDYGVYLKELSKLDGVPLMLEHMEEPEEYKVAGKYLRKVARLNNLIVK
jgi:sugar phosphate isomerase/epimerase